MARHKKNLSPDEDIPNLDISSLIDVCFLLLIYFLVTTQIVKKEQQLSSALPGGEPQFNVSEIYPLCLSVEANGNVSIKNESGLVELVESNADARKLPNLSKRLRLHKNASNVSGQRALVQIQVDGEVVQQRVTDVLNALAGAKITEITFVDFRDPEAS